MRKIYTDQLHARGFRMTPQRLAILQIINDSRKHLTPGEIFADASQRLPGITEATVYRTLSFLHQQNLILAAHIGNGQLVYEAAGHNHHHLICRACGRTQMIEHEMLETLYQQFHKKTGYKIDCMHMTFFGLCPDCQEKQD